jgi:very-short-patch-repair endonuclease
MAVKTNKLPVKTYTKDQIETLASARGLSVTKGCSGAASPLKKPYRDIYEIARALRANPPASERRFYKRYLESGLLHPKDLFNEVFNGRYIPDVTNHDLKYVIEIQGSMHNLEEVKVKDVIKAKYFISLGYEVFTVRDSLESFDSFMWCMLHYR